MMESLSLSSRILTAIAAFVLCSALFVSSASLAQAVAPIGGEGDAYYGSGMDVEPSEADYACMRGAASAAGITGGSTAGGSGALKYAGYAVPGAGWLAAGATGGAALGGCAVGALGS